MSKTLVRTICIVLAAALALGSVAVAAADRGEKAPPAATPSTGERQFSLEDITTRILAMVNRNRVEAVLDRLVEADRITRGEANQILRAWDEKYPDWKSPLERLTDRLMQLDNRNRVEAVLNRAVDTGWITQGEANQILKDWDQSHPDWQSFVERLAGRLMEVLNRNRVEAVLDRLVGEGRITRGEANQILKAWDEVHPNWRPSAPPARSRQA